MALIQRTLQSPDVIEAPKYFEQKLSFEAIEKIWNGGVELIVVLGSKCFYSMWLPVDPLRPE